MDQANPEAFLAELPDFSEFVDVANTSRYRALPSGWALAVADVVASSQAIADGKYKMVNMAGAAVITAVLNALGQNNYPFVFGGDGAVIAVPPQGISAVRQALADVARWIGDDLGLQMRVALVTVEDIRASGREVQIARLRASEDMSYAMFAGGGSAWAEAQMKDGRFAVPISPPGARPNLEGLSCRWDPVQSQSGQILSVIAVQGPRGDAASFRALVSSVVVLANALTRNPVRADRLQPRLYFGGVEAEARATAPHSGRLKARLRIAFAILMTVLSHRFNWTIGGFNARAYGKDLAANTDFRKFDDGLKMTLDIDAAGAAKIEAVLADAAAAGICRFGLHGQSSALVTCIVPSPFRRDHMHFVDGADGGYAQAAMKMKAKGTPPGS